MVQKMMMPRGLIIGIFAASANDPIPRGLGAHDGRGGMILFMQLQLLTPNDLTVKTETWNIAEILSGGQAKCQLS